MTRILIADDNPLSLQLFACLLRDHGHECRTAIDGVEAVQLAREEEFDLLLFDLDMPRLGGREALLRIRADEFACSRDAIAVATSAELDKATKRELRDAGFRTALPKPIDPEALRRAVTAALGGAVESITLDLEPACVPLARGSTCSGSIAGNAPPSSRGANVLLDESQALAACGDASVVDALRAMFAAELDALPDEMHRYAGSRDEASLRERLHRLRASCGFCGASALNEACEALRSPATQQSPERHDAALGHLLAVARATRAALP